MGKKTLSIFAENKVEGQYCRAWLNLSWSSLSSVSVDFHYLCSAQYCITGWRVKNVDSNEIIHNGIVQANDRATLTLSSGVKYAFQIKFLGSWLNGYGGSSYGSYFSNAVDPVFTLYEESGGGGGSTTPTITYASNSISFDETSYNFGSTGGEVKYSRSTGGTGNAPVLYVDGTKIATLGSKISAGTSVNESFSTSTYKDNFTKGSHRVELKVSEHTGTNVVTSAASASTTVEIYGQPSEPKVTQKIVSSSASGAYINTPTYDGDSTLYYSENKINWFDYSGSSFFYKDQVYYFKATHNITGEDSTILETKPVVSNIAKTIEISKVTPVILTAQSLLEGMATYARKVAMTVTTSAVSYSWYYRAAKAIDQLETAEEKMISSTTNMTQELTINDSSFKMGYYYQVGVSGTDNFGDSSAINWWTEETYQIAPIPEITELYNYFIDDNTFNIELANSNRFYTNLTFKFQYNAELTKNNIDIQYKKKDISSWNSITPKEDNIVLGNSNANGIFKISLPSTLESDLEYEFRIRYNLYGSEVFSNVIDQMYQINKNNIINNLSIYGGQEVFKPYTETGVLELRMAKPYENSFIENYTSAEQFQCQIIIDKQIILLDMIQPDGFKENSDYTVSFFFNKVNLYDKLKPLDLNQASSHKAILKLAVDNVFGLSHSKNLNITIDYKEKPTVVFNQPKYDNGTLLNSNSIIKENDKITFSFSFSDYNDETFRSCIQINRSDSSTPPDGQWIDYDQEIMHLQSGVESGYLTPIEYNDTRTITIKEITLPKYIFFRVRVTDSSGNMYSNYYDCGRSLQHTAPIIQQLNVTYKEGGNNARSENSIITGQLALVDLGIGLKDSSSLDLIDSANSTLTFQGTFSADGSGMTEISGISYSFEELIKKFQQNKNLTFTLPFDFEGQDVNYATLQLKAKTTINYPSSGLYSEKTFALSPFIVFNTLQTISYRKNRLAINVRDFDTNPDYEDAILVIGQANSSKNKIIYSAPNGSGYLINFIIDGGTW